MATSARAPSAAIGQLCQVAGCVGTCPEGVFAQTEGWETQPSMQRQEREVPAPLGLRHDGAERQCLPGNVCGTRLRAAPDLPGPDGEKAVSMSPNHGRHFRN